MHVRAAATLTRTSSQSPRRRARVHRALYASPLSPAESLMFRGDIRLPRASAFDVVNFTKISGVSRCYRWLRQVEACPKRPDSTNLEAYSPRTTSHSAYRLSSTGELFISLEVSVSERKGIIWWDGPGDKCLKGFTYRSDRLDTQLGGHMSGIGRNRPAGNVPTNGRPFSTNNALLTAIERVHWGSRMRRRVPQQPAARRWSATPIFSNVTSSNLWDSIEAFS
ncbi:hypothetical protein C8Q79DRAFT_183368 [Trametes meyenii]|nr:hypothetical protein C8Q79DRAFT_183368 [Trametes meyenii]